MGRCRTAGNARNTQGASTQLPAKPSGRRPTWPLSPPPRPFDHTASVRYAALAMRFLHTADWHLGRLFHGVHLTEDQAHVMAQLVEAVRETTPDVVLVAGDVYDRAVPPPEA